MTSAPVPANIAKFFAKHVTETKTVAIPELKDSDMESPTIQTTKTHIALLIPKKMGWAILIVALAGGPSLATYLANRLGLATHDELRTAVSDAVTASQKATQESLNKAVSDAVAPLKAEIATMKADITLQFNALDVRATKLERASKAKEQPKS